MDVLSGRFSASSLSGVKIFRFMALRKHYRRVTRLGDIN